MRHLRRWGAVYLMAVLFAASWVGQLIAQAAEVAADAAEHGQPFTWSDFWPRFLAATFENWQSEFLQLAVQAAVVVGAAHLLFRKSIEDAEEIKAALRELRNQRANRL